MLISQVIPLKLTINGQEREVQSNTLSELITELEIASPHFAVAVNLQVIPKTRHATTAIQDGDAIEIVHAVGGGL